MQPNVSIIIPNHNYGQWLSDAVMSAATDPYPNKTIMIIDDGSTDNSWDMICKLMKMKVSQPSTDQIYSSKIMNIPTYAYHFNEAGGPSRARNFGIQFLRDHTDLYGFLDSDDIYLPGKITKSVNIYLQDINKIGGIYTDYDTIEVSTNNRIRVYKEPFDYYRLMQECIIHSASMVNKQALLTCGLYDENMRCCEDYELWLRISQKFIFAHIPEPLMLVRVGSYNSTNTISSEIWQKNMQYIRSKYV